MAYEGSVELISGIKTKNNGTFPLVDAPDIRITDDLRLPGALDLKADRATKVNGHALSSDVTITKGDVGLGNCDNTSDADKPISTAAQEALNLKAPLKSPVLIGTPKSVTPGHDSDDKMIATKEYVDNAFEVNDAMVFKGTIGNSESGATVTSLPNTHKQGWTYKVITAGSYVGKECEVGDTIICINDGTTANNDDWTIVHTNIDGAVTGPTFSTDGNVALFNGNGGNVIKDSGFTIGKSVPSNAVFTDTTYSEATQSANGLMSSTDKTKLDGIATGATANTGTVTKVSTGAGLTGGDVTSTGIIKADLTSETKLTNAAADGTETSGRVYPVRLDKNGKLAVNVPWTDDNTTYTFDGTYNASTNKAATVLTVTNAITSHTHGNIQNGGTLQTNDITIANGDKLVVTDSSDSSKIARAGISFDGSTATQALTKKGTWETFAPSSTVSCTAENVKSALGTGSGTTKYLREDGTWQDPDPTFKARNEIGIVITGNTASQNVTSGQYVIVQNSTISGISDGLYRALANVSAGTAFTSANLTAVSNGGLNLLNEQLSEYQYGASGQMSLLTLINNDVITAGRHVPCTIQKVGKAVITDLPSGVENTSEFNANIFGKDIRKTVYLTIYGAPNKLYVRDFFSGNWNNDWQTYSTYDTSSFTVTSTTTTADSMSPHAWSVTRTMSGYTAIMYSISHSYSGTDLCDAEHVSLENGTSTISGYASKDLSVTVYILWRKNVL